MEPDEALSYALKRLAEDVLRECDLSIASAEVPKKYEESLIFGTVSTNLRKSSSHNIQDNKGALLSEELNQYVGADCPHIKDEVVVLGDPNSLLIQKNVDFPSVHNKGLCCFRGEDLTIGSEELKKDSIDLAEPPPNIDPHDPSYCAIKQAFTRCLNQIQELKTKLALAVQEISQLRQEQVLSETGQVFPVCRDISTETEEELLTPVFIKEESNVCTNIRSDNEEKIESEAQQNSGEDSNIFDSISAVVIQRRGRRKRTNVWKVTEQNLDDVSDVDEDNSDDNFMGDGGVSSNDNEENEGTTENSPNNADENVKTNSISPPSLRLSPRKLASGKQTKPKKKKKSGFHACDICFKSYGRAIDLRKHKLTHARNANNDYECEICKATFKRYAEIEKHSRIHRAPAIKSEPTSFPCSLPLCDKVLPDRLALKRHKKSHPKSCPVCNVSISCKNYSTHLRGHTGEKPYKCKQCTMSFIGPRHLARHVRVHTGEKPYSCTVCNKSFSEAGALRTHIRRHTGERPYVCETCGKAFAQLTGLTYHIRTHTGEKPYQCDLCSKSFAQVTGLENHKRTHTGEKPYCCDICGRCFAVAITFTQHKRTHTGERPYKCDVCSRAFTTGGALHRHKVIHAGVKPHICVVCGVAFARLGDLQRHVRTHTGIRPYKCDTCGKAFSRRSHLQAHGKTHVDKVNLRPRAKAHVPSSTSQGINRQTERYIERPIETGMERQLEQSLEPEQALLEQGGMEQGGMNPVHVRALTSEASPMYLGLGARGPQDMSYPNRSVFPDRTPAAGERHSMTPDSTTVYQERGGIGQERGPPVDPRVRPAPDQDRAGTVHERPANLQEFMPALPHHQMNIPPGVYPQWNFSFQ